METLNFDYIVVKHFGYSFYPTGIKLKGETFERKIEGIYIQTSDNHGETFTCRASGELRLTINCSSQGKWLVYKGWD